MASSSPSSSHPWGEKGSRADVIQIQAVGREPGKKRRRNKEGVNDGAAELRIELNRDDLRERIETNEQRAVFIFYNATIWICEKCHMSLS